MTEKQFLLDGWLVDTARGVLSRNEATVHLEPQVMKVLAYLAQRPNGVVTREELFDSLWDHAFVGNAALTRCIFEIRRAFGDNSRKPRVVETVPKIGFRLIATPQRVGNRHSTKRRNLFLASAAALVLSVGAVVFQSASSEFGRGSDHALNNVATQVFYNARENLSRHERVPNENAIVLFERAIELDPTMGFAYAGLANALYRQAMYWGGVRIPDARTAAAAAKRLLPDHAESHNALGLVHELHGEHDDALAAFARASQLDPEYADPISNAADVHRRRLEFKKATELYVRVVELEPSNVLAMSHLGFLHLRMGNLDEARAWTAHATNYVPHQSYAVGQLASLELVTGNASAAIDLCEEVHGLYPHHRRCLQILGTSNLARGNLEEAHRWFQQLRETFPDSIYGLLGETQVLMSNGQHEQADELLDDVLARATIAAASEEAGWSEYWFMAACHSLKGDVDAAFEWLEKAAHAGRRFHLWDQRDTVFSALHDDQRFDRYIAMTQTSGNQAL